STPGAPPSSRLDRRLPPATPTSQPQVTTSVGAGSGLSSDATIRAAGSRSSSRQDAGAPNRERRLPGGWTGGFQPPPPQSQPQVTTSVGAESGLSSDATIRAAGSRSSSRQDAGAPNRERRLPGGCTGGFQQ